MFLPSLYPLLYFSEDSAFLNDFCVRKHISQKPIFSWCYLHGCIAKSSLQNQLRNIELTNSTFEVFSDYLDNNCPFARAVKFREKDALPFSKLHQAVLQRDNLALSD